jgi:hypothetical protein
MLRLGKEFTEDERIKRVDEVINFVCKYFTKISFKFSNFSLI